MVSDFPFGFGAPGPDDEEPPEGSEGAGGNTPAPGDTNPFAAMLGGSGMNCRHELAASTMATLLNERAVSIISIVNARGVSLHFMVCLLMEVGL